MPLVVAPPDGGEFARLRTRPLGRGRRGLRFRLRPGFGLGGKFALHAQARPPRLLHLRGDLLPHFGLRQQSLLFTHAILGLLGEAGFDIDARRGDSA